ncbi:hypothetical protein [Actinomarinicola tropica]|uniref:Uncharacterized protein n=1 Tax=Actinomarinicola tropica TaxID=2789776 RepID=A0A5Q2REZ3_9ACTN|nr:hypothetical protein [Actinomarinicola tropica]QGG95389.1 hypothetical protein GH723_09940 [Actinomarinicola tropica]
MDVVADAVEWFTEHVPDGWFEGPLEVIADREELLVVGRLAAGTSPKRFREATRDARVAIARPAEVRYDRAVSWAVRVDDQLVRFSHLSVPVMTRLRVEERHVLDLLIEGGIARSRSEALAWCVRLVGANESAWLDELREAATKLAEIRSRGPAC